MTDPNKMVAYYKEHSISPVKQNISNLDTLFRRRAGLLEQLAMNGSFFKNKHLLEVGPGSGHNGLFFTSLHLSDYSMVEPNSTGVQDIKNLFTEHGIDQRNIQIYELFLDNFLQSYFKKFDIVWCENMLSGVVNPLQEISNLGQLVLEGGSLMITTMDEVCTFAENLRRLLSYAALNMTPKEPAHTDPLIPLLSSHLSNLKGMSRLHTDWIHDNIALPITAGYNVLSLSTALRHLQNDFTFVSSSPRFLTDWRWYKNIPLSEKSFTEIAADEYDKNIHSFFDYRYSYTPADIADTSKLIDLCRNFRDLIVALEDEWRITLLDEAKSILNHLIALIGKIAPNSKAALVEAESALTKVSKDPTLLQRMPNFAAFFGRNQQHVHLFRK